MAFQSLYFLSHMQRGLGRNRNAQGQVEAGLRLKAKSRHEDISARLSLAGPEHVIGIASSEVLRLVPGPDSVDLEPNVFPSIEFRQPDLPWMFSTQGNAGDVQLAPWLVLVVVEQHRGVELRDMGEGRKVLRIASPASPGRELPPLEESWAWAHVQVTADLADKDPDDVFAKDPSQFRSRLLCPRRLKPRTQYFACVVPATLGGLQKGLGMAVGEAPHGPAWTGSETRVDLPVYYSWSFRTADRGDFEHLVSKLEPVELQAGSVALDISDPGDPRLPKTEKAHVTFRGALVGTSARQWKWGRDHKSEYVEGMRRILETHRPGKPANTKGKYNALQDDPVVAPPLWGAYKIGETTAPEPPKSGNLEKAYWFSAVNFDPANRAAAGLGAECVRRNQEDLMAEAWAQAASLRDVNRELNQSRLAKETMAAMEHGKIAKLSDAAATNLAATARARLPVRNVTSGAGSLQEEQAQSAAPDGIYTSALNRIARKSGPLGKRAALNEPLATASLKWFETKPAQASQFADFVTPAKLVTGNLLGEIEPPNLNSGQRAQLSETVNVGTRRSRFRPKATLTSRKTVAKPQRKVAVSRGDTIATKSGANSTVKAALSAARPAFDASRMLAARLRQRITLPDRAWKSGPIPAAQLIEPQFDVSGYSMLRAISPDAIMPGVSDVPLNKVGLARVNAGFVESWLLGANAEMTREMLWREFPGQLTGTYFRRFWDTGEKAEVDIEAIKGWGKDPLGAHQVGAGTDGTLVLLVKGEVLMRYPDLHIYASQAAWDDRRFRFEPRRKGTPLKAMNPLFGGWLNRSTAFFAFRLGLKEAKGDLTVMGPNAGWFFVFEQPMDGLQFGLDVPPEDGKTRAPRLWEDLHWGQALDDPNGDGAQTHVSIDRGVGARQLRYAQDMFRESWGRSASGQARITLQRPMRVLLHASAMLP